MMGSNYIRGRLIGRAKVELRVGKLKNGKAAGKDEITEEIKMVDWIWRICNMAFKSVVPEDRRSAVIVLWSMPSSILSS